MSEDDRDRAGIAWFPLIGSLLVIGVLVIALIAGRPDSPAPVTTAATTTAVETTAPETIEAPGAATTPTETTPTVTTPIPDAVREDPVVQRLAKGRTLPFVAGPWTKAIWRDAVYSRLRPATQDRAEKVTVDNGFGIRIQ